MMDTWIKGSVYILYGPFVFLGGGFVKGVSFGGGYIYTCIYKFRNGVRERESERNKVLE